MRRPSPRSVSVAATAALVAALAPAISMVGAAHPAPPPPEPARELRSIYTSEYGVDRPTGVTYAPGRQALLVAGATASGDTKVVELTTGETRRGTAIVDGLADGSTVAFDPAERRLTALDGDEELSLGVKQLSGRQRPARAISDQPAADPRGSTYAPDGTQYVLDAASNSIITTSPSGAVTSNEVQGIDSTSIAGIAYNPADGQLYVADDEALHAVDADGQVTDSHDLGAAEIADLQAMTFAPSADPTDDPAQQSLYVADAGDDSTLGRVAELTTEPSVTAQANVDASLVASRNLAALTPPSPDSAGIAYIPGQDRLMVTDSEVNEMPLYAGVNMFTLQRNGTMTGGGTTLPWSNEPTGTAFGNGKLFTTDDDKKQIFEIPGAGADGVFGTGDDPARRTFKTTTFGNSDPEGAAFDTQRGHLLIVDGVGSEVFRLEPGPNGIFEGLVAGSDDVASQFDMTRHGAKDPEGIEYDAVRDTILVLDSSTEAIYELDENGSLLNVINVAAAGGHNVAGLAMAPASTGSGRNYYLVDRGLDNNSHPEENDGAMYEMSASLAPITNRPPAADAGPDLMGEVNQSVGLFGSAVDDGVPSATLTYQWTRVSGPGTVMFGDATAAQTTATFSAAGEHVLRLTANDSALTGFDEVTVRVFEPGGERGISIPIAASSDDANEGGGSNGNFVDLTSPDIELGNDGTPADAPDEMLAGLRFKLPVPKGAEIISAKVQFKVDEVGAEAASYTINAQDADNAPTFATGGGNLSNRAKNARSVSWSPAPWTTIGDAGPAQMTPELRTLVQDVVDRPAWAKDNAVALFIDGAPGTGRRTAEAKDGLTPPLLQLVFRHNTAPTVDAGPDVDVQRPASANLAGAVTDDGLPTPVALTTTWSQVGGPGTVSFGDAASPSTTAEFSQAGTYVLRLTANDSAMTAFDDVTVTVAAAEREVTLDPGRTLSVAGNLVPLSGRLVRSSDQTAVAGEDVSVFVRSAPAHQTRLLANVTTSADGSFSLGHRPKTNSRYYAEYGTVQSAISLVRVRPRLSVGIAPTSVKIGSAARVEGTLSPSAAKTPLRLQRWNGSRWVRVQQILRPAARSVGYRFTVRLKSTGAFRYRVYAPAYAGRSSYVTPARVLKVYNAKIRRVQPDGKEFVVVRNTGKAALNLNGWQLRNNRNGRRVGLPAFGLRPGTAVRIHTGAGRNDRNDLFLGRRPMWGSHGVAVLRDNRALWMDRHRF